MSMKDSNDTGHLPITTPNRSKTLTKLRANKALTSCPSANKTVILYRGLNLMHYGRFGEGLGVEINTR